MTEQEDKDTFERFYSYLKRLKEERDLEYIHDAFILWFGEEVLEIEDELEDRIVKDSNAEGIDAIFLDKDQKKFYFIQGKTIEDFGRRKRYFPENDIKKAVLGADLLITGSYKGNITPELENLVDEFHNETSSGLYEVKLIFLTMKKQPLSDRYITDFRNRNQQVKVEFFDFDRVLELYRAYLAKTGPGAKRISLEVVKHLTGKHIIFKDAPLKARIFTVKGSEIAKSYDSYKDILFEQNVRLSLGLNNINTQIFNTATNTKSSSFWYFNNGITIACKRIDETPAGNVVHLNYAQIINGAQTTYALHKAYMDNGTPLKPDVEVLVKVIETDDQDLINDITLYVNSQNAIKTRDLQSKDIIQNALQRTLLDSYNYFFERKRGEFVSYYPNQEIRKEKFGENYKKRLINNEKAAQSFLAFYLDKPAEAKNAKRRIFDESGEGFYRDIFNQNILSVPEKLIMSWRLLNYIEDKKRTYRRKYRGITILSRQAARQFYRKSFVLHSEYVILNLFKDFLINDGFDINKKADLLRIIELIDTNNKRIQEYYDKIVDTMADYIGAFSKANPGYYHNKFFKNEGSLTLVRSNFNQEFKFVKIIS